MKDNSNKFMMILAIVIIIATIIGIVCYVLYQKTDFGKSKEVLFKKYIIQNVEYVSSLLDISKEREYINKIIKEDYTKKAKVKLKYDDEEYNFDINSINNKQNKEMYKNINICYENQDLMKLEILGKDNVYGLRFSDVVEQFISIRNEEINDFETNLGLESKLNVSNFNVVDFLEGIDFTEEERNTLLKTYYKLFFQNLEKTNYSSQNKKVITLSNGESLSTKAYSLTLSQNELENIEKRILNNLKEDEIILAKLEKVDENIKESGIKDVSIKEYVLDYINNELNSFEYTGKNDMKYKITAYQNKGVLVRTTIEYNETKILIDINSNNEIKNINVKYYNNVDNQEVLKIYNINKEITETGYNIDFTYKVDDNEYNVTREINENDIKTTIIYKENEKEKFNFDLKEELIYETKTIESIENNKIIVLNDYNSLDQIALISNLEGRVKEHLNSKQTEFNSKILEKTIEIMDNIVEDLKSKQQDNESTERIKFNSLFELYKGEEVKAETVLELISVASKNMKEYKAVGNKIRIYLEKGNYPSGKEEEIKALINTKLTYIVSMGYNEEGGIETITLIPNEKK